MLQFGVLRNMSHRVSCVVFFLIALISNIPVHQVFRPLVNEATPSRGDIYYKLFWTVAYEFVFDKVVGYLCDFRKGVLNVVFTNQMKGPSTNIIMKIYPK